MRLKRWRGRLAGELKSRADKTTSPSVYRHFSRAIRAIYPFERRVPKGQVFIPSKQLSEEAQDVISRIQSHLKTAKAGKIFMPITISAGFGGGIGVSLFGAAYRIDPTNPKIYVPVALAVGAIASAYAVLALKAERSYKQSKRDIEFLGQFLQKSSNSRIRMLRPKFNFFYLHPKLKGIVLSKLTPEAMKFIGSLKQGEVVVIDKKTGDITYQGPERRHPEMQKRKDRRSSQRRDDRGKEEFQY